MSTHGQPNNIVKDRPSRPRASERQTRARAVLWDRIKLLLFLGILWLAGLAVVWSTTVRPLEGPFLDAVRIAVDDYWWLLALMVLEFTRQVHYFIEERSKGYYRFWQHRMFLLSGRDGGGGDGRYLDVLERSLYNGLLAGVSLSGDRFFYINPLASDGVTPFNYGGEVSRAAWFKCSCCPVNIARFLASLGGYVYGARTGEVSVNLFIAGRGEVDVPGVGRIVLTQQTLYPWDGHVRLTIEPASDDVTFTLRVRVPGWAQGRPVPSELYRYVDAPVPPVALRVNGASIDLEIQNGMAVIRRAWRRGDWVELDLPMVVRRVVAHEKVAENAGRVALERGPIVYCVRRITVPTSSN